jgi:hypothetical protein
MRRRKDVDASGDVGAADLDALRRRRPGTVERHGGEHSQGLVEDGVQELDGLEVGHGEFAGDGASVGRGDGLAELLAEFRVPGYEEESES